MSSTKNPAISTKRKSIETSDRRKKATIQPQRENHMSIPDPILQEQEKKDAPLGIDINMENFFDNILHVDKQEFLLCIEGHRVVDDGWVFLCQFTNKTKQIWVHERELKRSNVDHVMYYLKKHISVNRN